VTLDGFLIAHGSALILPLAVIEGPVVSVLVGVLSGRGDFHWYWALCLLACGDLIGDMIYYWVGRSGRAPIAGLGRVLRIRNLVTPAVQRGLRHNAVKMQLIGKWTHSIGCIVLVGSGMLRLPFARFMLVNLLATVPKSAVLFGLGYFADSYCKLFEHHVVLATIALGALGGATIALILRNAGRPWASRFGSHGVGSHGIGSGGIGPDTIGDGTIDPGRIGPGKIGPRGIGR
jgi:membrane-associated protein